MKTSEKKTIEKQVKGITHDEGLYVEIGEEEAKKVIDELKSEILKLKSKPDFFEDFKDVQENIQTIKKTSKGEIDSKSYKFADIVAVWDEIKDKIRERNFIVTHGVFESQGKEALRTIVIHKSGKELKSSILIEGKYPQDKGSEITYYKRYNLSAIFNINAEGEDTDAKGIEPFDSKKSYSNNPILKGESNIVDPIYVREMKDEAKRVGINNMEDLLEFLSSKGVQVSKFNRETCSQITKILKERK